MVFRMAAITSDGENRPLSKVFRGLKKNKSFQQKAITTVHLINWRERVYRRRIGKIINFLERI